MLSNSNQNPPISSVVLYYFKFLFNILSMILIFEEFVSLPSHMRLHMLIDERISHEEKTIWNYIHLFTTEKTEKLSFFEAIVYKNSLEYWIHIPKTAIIFSESDLFYNSQLIVWFRVGHSASRCRRQKTWIPSLLCHQMTFSHETCIPRRKQRTKNVSRCLLKVNLWDYILKKHEIEVSQKCCQTMGNICWIWGIYSVCGSTVKIVSRNLILLPSLFICYVLLI